MFASEVVLAKWQAAERRLAEAPDAWEADELRALVDRLRREYNEIRALTIDPPPPPVVSPPKES